jgi:hypothetical protein
MRYDEIECIWDVDFGSLSRADHGKVYFERAKHVVNEALGDPRGHPDAIKGKRFSRSYLVDRIGSGPAVTTQNPGIKSLLETADRKLGAMSSTTESDRVIPGQRSDETLELRALVDTLRRQLTLRDVEIAELTRKLQASSWLDDEGRNLGVLPW